MVRSFQLDPCGERALRDHERWMRRRRVSNITSRRRRYAVCSMAEFISPKPLLQVRPNDIERWFDELVARGLMRSSIRAHATTLQGFLAWAIGEQLVSADILSAIPQIKVPPRPPRPIREDDLRRVIASAEGRTRTWIILGAYAGLRVSEIALLRREDVRDDWSQPCLITTGKGGFARFRWPSHYWTSFVRI